MSFFKTLSSIHNTSKDTRGDNNSYQGTMYYYSGLDEISNPNYPDGSFHVKISFSSKGFGCKPFTSRGPEVVFIDQKDIIAIFFEDTIGNNSDGILRIVALHNNAIKDIQLVYPKYDAEHFLYTDCNRGCAIIQNIRQKYEEKMYYESDYYKCTHKEFSVVYGDKGLWGEYLCERVMKVMGNYSRVLFNLMIPDEDGSFQEIDAVGIDDRGFVFVFEAKNRSGIISGDIMNKMLTQEIGRQRNEFYNPAMQNHKHIVTLGNWFLSLYLNDNDNRELLTKLKNTLAPYSIVMFSNCEAGLRINCSTLGELNFSNDSFLQFANLTATLEYFNALRSTEEAEETAKNDLDKLYALLYPHTQYSEYEKKMALDEREARSKEKEFQNSPDYETYYCLVINYAESRLFRRVGSSLQEYMVGNQSWRLMENHKIVYKSREPFLVHKYGREGIIPLHELKGWQAVKFADCMRNGKPYFPDDKNILGTSFKPIVLNEGAEYIPTFSDTRYFYSDFYKQYKLSLEKYVQGDVMLHTFAHNHTFTTPSSARRIMFLENLSLVLSVKGNFYLQAVMQLSPESIEQQYTADEIMDAIKKSVPENDFLPAIKRFLNALENAEHLPMINKLFGKGKKDVLLECYCQNGTGQYLSTWITFDENNEVTYYGFNEFINEYEAKDVDEIKISQNELDQCLEEIIENCNCWEIDIKEFNEFWPSKYRWGFGFSERW